jgi:O-antigen/teichoic acid export membrane protein
VPDLLVLVLVLLALAGASVWFNVATIRRNKKKFAEHPETRPYGRNLLLRALPFVAIGVAALVYGVVDGNAVTAVLGGVAVVGFAIEITRRWNPPVA